jgi:hypothetical protein
VALVAVTLGAAAAAAEAPRVALLVEPSLPAVGAPAPDLPALRGALAGLPTTELDARALAAGLDRAAFDVLVLPYGAAFPEPAWPAIERFLAAGGSWVNLGGVPLAAPAARDGSGWRPLAARTAYAKSLGIVQSYLVSTAGLACRATAAGDGALCAGLAPATVQELIVRLTSTAARPAESGSDGEREARVTALAHLYGDGDLPLAAPLVRVDRLLGRFAAGRWVLATGDAPLPPATVRRLIEDAAAGASELTVAPSLAAYRPGETPEIEIRLTRPGRPAAAGGAAVRVTLRDPAGAVTAARDVTLAVEGGSLAGRVALPLPDGAATGLWTLRAELAGGSGAVAAGENGFRLHPVETLAGGEPLAAGPRYLERGGRPFPVIGTTYMAGDAHRRFLLEPNPAVWERDFAAMARAGVNLVRTGIWTGWAAHCGDGPEPREAVLRALEAYVLTARAHGIPVIFTFFAFVPEAWGGANPYLDPAAVAAQRAFVGGFARRLAGARDVAWDLINEPSFSSPERLWQCRPNYDAHEAAAWRRWTRTVLAAGADDPEAELADRWNLLAGEALDLPPLADFGDRNLFEATRPRRAADYKRFAQSAFTAWARELSQTLRAAGNPAALVTVGQDEGGIAESPSPLEHGRALDFTCNHTWWLNDALLWDSLVSRLPDRPNLVEETGVMTVERLDGGPWRNEEESRNLLERKLVTAFGAGAAGAVQWLWNTNVYMPIDNEAGIGLLRAAGTAKPEAAAFAAVARFVAAHAARFRGAEDEEVAVVLPHSQMQSARDLGTAASQRAVRVLEHELRVPVRIVGEGGLDRLGPRPHLLVLPSPRVLRDDAWRGLLALADAGATVLVTGTFDRDEVERPRRRAAALGVTASLRPVAQEESVTVGGATVAARFRGSRVERAEKAVLAGDSAATLHEIARGAGALLWCPLPVELAEGPEATAAVYAAALARAGVRPPLEVRGAGAEVLVRPVLLADAVLVALVNESDEARAVAFRLRGAPAEVTVTLAPRRSVLAMVERASGRLLGTS